MRYAILISLLVCGACVALKDFAGRGERVGAGPRPPLVMQPAVTQAELDARCAARAADMQQGLRKRQPPAPAQTAQACAAGAAAGLCDRDDVESWER